MTWECVRRPSCSLMFQQIRMLRDSTWNTCKYIHAQLMLSGESEGLYVALELQKMLATAIDKRFSAFRTNQIIPWDELRRRKFSPRGDSCPTVLRRAIAHSFIDGR